VERKRVKSVLHVGCGGDSLPPWLDGYRETRCDINPKCNPDVVASMTNLGQIGQFDIVYCCHALEHLYPHEVHQALQEFLRVLVPGGYAAIFVPDLEGVQPTAEPLYASPAGPITGLDMYYGKQSMIAANPHMAHHTGFVQSTLLVALQAAGFSKSKVDRVSVFNLFGVGVK
jgi:SAM-dependent methyltransferase